MRAVITPILNGLINRIYPVYHILGKHFNMMQSLYFLLKDRKTSVGCTKKGYNERVEIFLFEGGGGFGSVL